MSSKKRNKSLSEEEWLSQALDVLTAKGPEYLSLRRLTDTLGVTTGSFYWHFENRKAFLKRLFEYWGETSTVDAADFVAAAGGTPEERLYQLMLFVFDHDSTRHDAIMRAWASREPGLEQHVQQVEQFRFNFIRGLFKEMGFKNGDLQTRAHLCLAYMSAHRIVLNGLSEKQRRNHLKAALKLLTQP